MKTYPLTKSCLNKILGTTVSGRNVFRRKSNGSKRRHRLPHQRRSAQDRNFQLKIQICYNCLKLTSHCTKSSSARKIEKKLMPNHFDFLSSGFAKSEQGIKKTA